MSIYCLNISVSTNSKEEIINDIYNQKSISIAGCNVNTAVRSYFDKNLSEIINSHDYRIPDGYPLTWPINISSRKNFSRLAGADIFDSLIENDKTLKHFFIGGTEEVLEKMNRNIRKINDDFQICGLFSPPFSPLDDWDISKFAEQILESQADMLWVGLGFPKQEIFMQKIKPLLPGVSMYGAGAIFQWTAGEIKRAPKAWQSFGFEWLWRLLQDPKRLWKRYFQDNTLFILLFLYQLIKNPKFDRPLKN